MHIFNKFVPQSRIQRMAIEHIDRFMNLLSSDHPSVNKKECEHYLGIWNGINKIAGKPSLQWNDFAPFEKAEILDAIADEE